MQICARPLLSIVAVAALAMTLAGCHPPLEQIFVFSGDAPSRTGLLTLDDGVLFGNEAGAVTLVGWDGHLIWRTMFGREVAARPAVAGTTLVVATLSGEWAGLSPLDGKERWRIVGQPTVLSPLASDLTRVFAITSNGSVRAIDPATGTTLWSRAPAFAGAERRVFPAPIAWEGDVFVALGDAGLISVGGLDGALNWKDPHVRVVGMTVVAGKVFITTRDGQLRALRTGDGSTIWSTSLGAPAASAPSFLKGWLWVGREDNSLAAFDAKDGSLAWTSALPARAEASAVELRETVLVPTSGTEGQLLGFLQTKHSAAFKVRLDNQVRSAPVVRYDHAYVLASDGRLFGFRINSLER